MLEILKIFIPTFIAGMAVDFLWLGVIAGNFYKSQLAGIIRATKDFSFAHWASASFVYIIVVAGIMFFVLPKATSTLQAGLYGAIFGFATYGIYEFTNYALLLNWPAKMVFVDLAWGIVLCTILSVVAYQVKGWVG
jgi:uncharacterized membrane protein